MDSSLKESEVKEHLAPYLKVPVNYFRIVDSNLEDISSAYHLLKFRDDREYFIDFGRIVLPDEHKVEIHLLEMDSLEVL